MQAYSLGNFGILFSLTLFIIGVLAILFNGGRNLIMIIISLELILLSIGLILILLSFYFDDLIGATLTLYLLPQAGCESAIGLALMVTFYPLRGTLFIR